ncbi:hypothetical protein [Parasitella parasitica]|uniref:Uncharacterized protein n=1 Tax=Parasitella parasitica TaxID=35722 RepID=A0A0B7N8J6_9FUNG|nr:hypothetical protein [Parasitella parasitica]
MDQESKYKECKKRNEQQLLNLGKLGNPTTYGHTTHTRMQIEQKQIAVKEVKRKQSCYQSIKQAQSHNQQQQQELLVDELHPKSPLTLISGRRDLTQLLPTTPEMICKKLELYIKRQYERQAFINEKEILQVRQLINRLPEKHDKQQAHQMVDALLRQLQNVSVDKAKYEYKIRDTAEYKEIERYEMAQRAKIRELLQRKDDLERETKDAETNLIRRIRELYADPVVQSAIAKNIRIKAANHQVDAELETLKAQAETLIDNIESSKEAEAPINKETKMQDIEEKTLKIVEHLNSLIHANEKGNDAIRNDRVQVKLENRESLEQLLDDIKKEKVRLQLERLNMHKPSMNPPDSASDATTIKNALSPYTSISITEALSEIVNIVDSVNYFSEKSVENICADIRTTLEKLAKKWEASLEKQNISIIQDIPECHDGIDNVIQSVDALREHIEHTEQQYIQEQQAILKAKMDTAEQVNIELEKARSLLDERASIKHVGKEYEIQSKNFSEWLDYLEMDANNADV